MRVLSRFAGWMLGAALTLGCTGTGEATGAGQGLPAVGRPSGVSQGPRVAVVGAVHGDVKVEPGEGTSFAAVPELQLLRDDRLVVGPDSFVLVALYNGHAVRLNAGASLRVDAMATFGDPPAGTDLEESFALLLTPSERDDLALRGAITRVAGWNTRMTATETLAPQAPPTPPHLEEPARNERPDAQPIDAGTPPPGAATPLEHNGSLVGTGRGGGGTGDGAIGLGDVGMIGGKKFGKASIKFEPDSGEIEVRDVPTTDSPSEPPGPWKVLDLPRTVVHQADRDGTRTRVSLPGLFTVVRAELAACAGAGAKIRGRIAGKKLVELQFDGAPMECVPGLIGEAVALEDGWIEMIVTP